MAHLSCVGEPVERLREILDGIQASGIENVLALRGDPPRGETEWKPHPGGLRYSTELAKLISDNYDFAIGAACFPEVHPEAPDMAHDIRFLKEKIASGVGFLITQLFYDNELYFNFVEEARAAGITVPIIPGIMPVTNFGQIKRITEMCKAALPEPFERELAERADHPEAVTELGVAYAALQCADLLARGAPGIYSETLKIVEAAERGGLDLIGIQDHPYQRRFLDTFALIGDLLARTERLRFFPDVANLPLRNPAMLAKQAASLDAMSGGRFELGLGAGTFWDRIAAMGGARP